MHGREEHLLPLHVVVGAPSLVLFAEGSGVRAGGLGGWGVLTCQVILDVVRFEALALVEGWDIILEHLHQSKWEWRLSHLGGFL